MQEGKTRAYSNVDERTSPLLKLCPNCKVNSVPRGITDVSPLSIGEKHCPNCGHVYGRKDH